MIRNKKIVPTTISYATVSNKKTLNNLQVAKLALERSKIKKLNNLEKAKRALEKDPMLGIKIVPKSKKDKQEADMLTSLLGKTEIDKRIKDYFLEYFTTDLNL